MGSFGGGFASGLVSGAAVGRNWRELYEQGQLQEELAKAAAKAPTVTEQASGEEAQKNLEANFVPQEGGPQTAAEYLQQNPAIAQALQTQKAGFNVGDRSFTDRTDATNAAAIARAGGIADVLDARGLTDQAHRTRSGAVKLADAERGQADEAELRRVLNRDQSELRSSVGTGGGITGASDVLGLHENSPALRAENAATADAKAASALRKVGGGQQGAEPIDDYLKRTAPLAVQTLVKQGRFTEAQKFADFVESETGRAYATRWLAGVRKHSIGDSTGALRDFEALYNAQMYDDGRTVKLTPIDGGKRFKIQQFDLDGNPTGEHEGETASLADQAAAALSPLSAVAFAVKRQAMLEREGAIADRQLSVEDIRQAGRSAHEDRVDTRQQRRLEAAGNRRGGGLTLAQQRANAEIDAAREAVTGLDPADIRKRTAKTTDTGRENDQYDPALARAAALAGRRKVGDDPVFDQRQGGQQPQQQAPALDRKEVATRFRADKAMNAYTLGRDTPQGVEVLSGGRVVGHYR